MEFRINDVIGAMPLNEDEFLNMDEKEREEYRSPSAVARRAEVNRHIVYGHDHKLDRNGEPIPQGLGSPGNETPNHWAALLAAERRGDEPPGTTARLKAEAERRKAAARS
jgi:hypothetical protein